MKNITQRCVNQLELTGINLLEQIQPNKIQTMQAREILRKTIRSSQKDLHLLARRILLKIPFYYSQHLCYLTVDHSVRLSLKI